MSVMSQCYSIIIDSGISAPGHGKEVVYGLNDVDKSYIYQLMSTIQLTGSNRFDSQMQMHTSIQKYDVNLDKEFQEHLTKEHQKYGAIDQKKYCKRFMDRKRTYINYHIQYNSDIEH